MAMTNNKKVLQFIDESAALCQPDKIVWIDGSKEQIDQLRAEACSTGELIKLNEDLLPECFLHRTAVNDVARVEDRTFICCKNKEDAGPINNWMDPKEAYSKVGEIFKGSMKGRTMYVIPYSMGPIGSPLAKVGVELTDSIYVVLNMNIMTRMGADAFKKTRSGPSTPLTAATFCWARSASLCVSLPSRARTKAGWLNTC